MNSKQRRSFIATLVVNPEINDDRIFIKGNILTRICGHESFKVIFIKNNPTDKDCFKGEVIESNMPEMEVGDINWFGKGFFNQSTES